MASMQSKKPLPGAASDQRPGPVQRASTTGLKVPTNKKTIYDRNLNRSRTAELSRASFAFLFSEMVSYAQKRVSGIADLEKRLNNQGYPIGMRLLDLLLYREPARSQQRPTRILPLLTFLSQTLWRHLFSRPADAVESATDNERQYMISDNEPLVNQYISVPKEMSALNCAAFVAGIIEGVCDGAGFTAEVTAQSVPSEMWPGRTIFVIEFKEGIVEREAVLGPLK